MGYLTWAERPASQETWWCGGEKFVTTNLVTDYATYVDTYKPANPARVKPPAPLWKSPTPLGPFWKKTRYYGYQTNSWWRYGVVNCSAEGRRVDVWREETSSYGSPDYPSAVAQTLSTEWQLALRKKIKSDTMNLGVALVEFRETVSFLTSTMSKAYNLYRWTRGKLPKKLRRKFHSDDIPKAWLTGQFGVTPLVADCFDLYLAMALASQRELWRRYVVTKSASQTVKSTKWDGRDLTSTATLKERAIVYVQLDVNQPVLFGNTAELMWEGIPFSFLVDYMIDMGDRLSALDALKGVKELVGTKTRITLDSLMEGPDPGWAQYAPSGRDHKTFVRSVLSKDSIPAADLIPTYKPSDSIMKLANASALFWSVKANNKRAQKGNRKVLEYLRGMPMPKYR